MLKVTGGFKTLKVKDILVSDLELSLAAMGRRDWSVVRARFDDGRWVGVAHTSSRLVGLGLAGLMVVAAGVVAAAEAGAGDGLCLEDGIGTRLRGSSGSHRSHWQILQVGRNKQYGFIHFRWYPRSMSNY